MVIVGIIAVLLAILIPTIHMAVEQSRRVSCLGHVRSLTAAILAYTTDNDSTLPDACGSNSFESQLSPISNEKPAGSRLGGGFYVLPSIGALLQPYLSPGYDVWNCPSASMEAQPLVSGVDPLGGYLPQTPPNLFYPRYDYLSAKEYIQYAMAKSPAADQTKLRTWAARNVSGLRVSKLTPLGGNSRVVLIHDRQSYYHAKSEQAIYTYPSNWDYYQNFGYLDGHAEGIAFQNVTEYLACIHGPIRQSWCGIDFTKVLPEQYAGY